MLFFRIKNPAFALIVRIAVLLSVAVPAICQRTVDAFAQIASEESLYDSTWNYLFEDGLTHNGVIQSICATPDYLITIENTSEDPSQPDTVSAYYKNPFDHDGNPVEQYSLAMRNADSDWEHGNGMAYNPNTNEIYVALYSNDAGDNEGCLYVMDPDTLSFKRKIKIAEGYNILGIDYDSENDQYYTLTNAAANYSLERRDADFHLIEDLGPIDPSPGTNFQDICVSGDYIFLSPLTFGMGIGDFMNIYSISRRLTLLSIDMNMGLEAQFVEAEGVCMAHKGVFVCPVTVTWADGTRHVYFFETTLPWFYTIETSARGMTYEGDYTVYTLDVGDGEATAFNMDEIPYTGMIYDSDANAKSDGVVIGGKISTGTQQALSGTSYTVSFEPSPGYKVAAVYMDVTQLEVEEGATSVTIDNIDGNHRITVDFIPESKPASGGSAATASSQGDNPNSPIGPTESLTTAANQGDDSKAGRTSGSNTANKEDSAGAVSGQLSETQISAADSAYSETSATAARKKATRKKAFAFTVLILIILVLGLALLILYIIHVRRVRERKLRARKEERRQRRMQEETRKRAARKRRRRRLP
ncbi:MAG: hypothetical protein Q4A32_09060 [Lachnospiraceae bacterium]|nr:hypothetical protein [Lachnospiraceae bacterium]